VSDLFEGLKQKVSGRDLKIVFPEGLDERIVKAASRLAEEKWITPILVGNIDEVQAKAKDLGVSLDAAEIYDPKSYAGMDELVAAFVDRRKGKVT
jgi:phosphate acetyltransferase